MLRVLIRWLRQAELISNLRKNHLSHRLSLEGLANMPFLHEMVFNRDLTDLTQILFHSFPPGIVLLHTIT